MAAMLGSINMSRWLMDTAAGGSVKNEAWFYCSPSNDIPESDVTCSCRCCILFDAKTKTGKLVKPLVGLSPTYGTNARLHIHLWFVCVCVWERKRRPCSCHDCRCCFYTLADPFTDYSVQVMIFFFNNINLCVWACICVCVSACALWNQLYANPAPRLDSLSEERHLHN